MVLPAFLKRSDKVALVSTARKLMPGDIEFSLKYLQSWGLEIVLGVSIFNAHYQFSGTDDQRVSDFQVALDDPEIRAIFCVRGGYGTVRMIDALDFTKFSTNPKWVIGYSDVTVLHCHLNTVLDVASIHATMPINYEKNSSEALLTLEKALFTGVLGIQANASPFNRKGVCEAKIVGGNLSILYSLLGSSTSLDTEDKILFIEDLDEYLYHIDRMMISLKRAGKLSNLAGLIVGGMTDMHDNPIPFGKSAVEIIAEHVSEYEYPVAFAFPAGHIDDNRAIIFNKKANLTVDSSIVRLAFL